MSQVSEDAKAAAEYFLALCAAGVLPASAVGITAAYIQATLIVRANGEPKKPWEDA